MNDEKIRKQFKKAVKYKDSGFVILMSAIVPVLLLDGLVKYMAAGLFLAIGIYLEKQFKCPACKYEFDTRIKPEKLMKCPKCNKKLQ